MVTNLAYFYETSQKTRGGKWVWVKDSNGEERKNVLLGGTILNPKKGFDHLYAAQLVQYTPSVGMLIFRSFGVKTATAAATDTTIYLNGDGYGDAPEVGMLIMKAPSAANGTGQSALVTNVVYDEANEQFAVTLFYGIRYRRTADSETGKIVILIEHQTAVIRIDQRNEFVRVFFDLRFAEFHDEAGTSDSNYFLNSVKVDLVINIRHLGIKEHRLKDLGHGLYPSSDYR